MIHIADRNGNVDSVWHTLLRFIDSSKIDIVAVSWLGYKKTDSTGNTEIPNNFDNSANNPENTTDTNEAALYSRKPEEEEKKEEVKENEPKQ